MTNTKKTICANCKAVNKLDITELAEDWAVDYKPFETWSEEGGNDTVLFASKRVEYLLSNYSKPHLEPSIDEALQDFIKKKKESQPDKLY